MLKNGFVSDDVFNQFAENRLVEKCEMNRFFTSMELRDFFLVRLFYKSDVLNFLGKQGAIRRVRRRCTVR
jgi:hypothetical protein